MYVTFEVDKDELAWGVSRGSNDEAFDLIAAIDENIAELEFTQRLYEYAKQILEGEGVDV